MMRTAIPTFKRYPIRVGVFSHCRGPDAQHPRAPRADLRKLDFGAGKIHPRSDPADAGPSKQAGAEGALRILIHILAICIIVVIAGGLAFLSLDPLASRGVFGSCFEGACGYAAIFVGFPLIWLALTIIGIIAWVFWNRRR